MKQLLFTIAVILLGQNLFAQDSFTELVNLPEKKLSKTIHIWGENDWRPDTKDGTGIIPDLSQADIKKVALVSFTISIPHVFTERFLTEEGNRYFVDKLYDGSLESMKETFMNKGIELITKENMTEEQLSILSGAQAKDKLFETSLDVKQDKLESTYEKVEEKGVSAGIEVEGYKNWVINQGLPISFDLNVYGALTRALGVDAILLINNEVTPEARSLTFNKTIMTMYGENPIPKNKEKKYPGMSYLNGLPYSQVTIASEFEMASFKKKAIESENMDGYDQVISLLVDTMMKYIDINTQRSKEKYEKDHK